MRGPVQSERAREQVRKQGAPNTHCNAFVEPVCPQQPTLSARHSAHQFAIRANKRTRKRQAREAMLATAQSATRGRLAINSMS